MKGAVYLGSKLKKRIIIIICLFILFITIVFNLHRIRFALGMYNIYSQEKNTDIVSESNEPQDTVEILNPLTSIIESVNDNEDVKQEDPGQNEPIVEKDDLVDKWPDPVPADKHDATKPYLNIVKEYNVKLESLRSSFESNLEDLIDQGIAEYKSGVSTAKIGAKYLNSGTQLEKASDNQFNALVKEMEKELKANNHDTKVIGEVKEYYTSFKKSKKQEVVSNGMKYMK